LAGKSESSVTGQTGIHHNGQVIGSIVSSGPKPSKAPPIGSWKAKCNQSACAGGSQKTSSHPLDQTIPRNHRTALLVCGKFGYRGVVEIATENDRARLIIAGTLLDFARIGQAFVVLGPIINVRIHEDEVMPVDVEDELQKTALLTLSQHAVVRVSPARNREPRQHGIAILAALVRENYC
jgi:hypothetical protein